MERKNHSCKRNGTTLIGIAINVVFIQANPDNMLQLREDLSPLEWAGKNDNNSLIEKKIMKIVLM